MALYLVALLLMTGAYSVLFLVISRALKKHFRSDWNLLLDAVLARMDKWYFAVIFFLAVAVLFHIDKVLMGPLAGVRMHDTFDSEFAKYKNYGDLLFRYGFFQWYPNAPGGMPSFASQFTPLHPLAVLCHFLPMWLVYTLDVLFLMTAAGFGAYRLFRKFFLLEKLPSFAGGVLFCLLSQVQANNIIPTVFNYVFPLYFTLFLDLTGQGVSMRKKILSGLGILALFSLSYPAITIPMFGFLQLFLILFLNPEKRDIPRQSLHTFVVWTGYVLLFAPLIYGLFSYLPFSHRTYHQAGLMVDFWNGAAIWLKGFNYVLFYYLTKCGLLIAVIAMVPLLAVSGRMRALFALLFAGLVISGFYMSDLAGLLSGTFLAKFDLVHFIWILPLSGLFIAVAGMSELSKNRKMHLPCIIAAGLGLVYSGWMTFSSPAYARDYSVNLLIDVLVAFVMGYMARSDKNTMPGLVRFLNREVFTKKRGGWLAVTAGVLVLSLIFTALLKEIRVLSEEPENTPYARYFGGHSSLKSLGGKNPLPFRAGFVDNNPSMIAAYGIEMVDARGPLFNKRFKDIMRLVVMKQLDTPGRLAFYNDYWYNLYINNNGIEWNLPLLLLVNTKYILSSYPHSGLMDISEGMGKAESDMVKNHGLLSGLIGKKYAMPIYIFRLRDAFERAFLASGIRAYENDEKTLEAMSRQDIPGLRNYAYYNTRDLPAGMKTAKDAWDGDIGTVTQVFYSPDEIRYRVSNTVASALVISVNYHPNWKAEVDGKKAKIIRTDHAFQSVYLDQKGEHTVVFRYEDPVQNWIWLALIPGIFAVFSPLVFRPGKIRRKTAEYF